MSNPAWRASPILRVANVRTSAEYYRDVLGFDLDPDDGVFQPIPTEPGGVYGIVKRANVWIHFQIRRGEIPQRTRSPLERDVYIYLSDLDSYFAELKQRGAVILQPPQLAPYGVREMVVEDLNGMRIAFGEIQE